MMLDAVRFAPGRRGVSALEGPEERGRRRQFADGFEGRQRRELAPAQRVERALFARRGVRRDDLEIVPGREKGDFFSPFEARISVSFHSFRLIFVRKIISR